MSTPNLFTPIQVGDITLQHRIVLAPLTRFRAQKNHTHNKIAIEYYAQRACTPGTLLITEDTIITPQAGGVNNVPGIWNAEQIAAWKEVQTIVSLVPVFSQRPLSLLCSTQVVDAVHLKGSFIYLQLWALGRLADPHILKEEGPFPYVSASDVKLTNNQSVSYTSSSGSADEDRDIVLHPLTTDGNSSFSDIICC